MQPFKVALTLPSIQYPSVKLKDLGAKPFLVGNCRATQLLPADSHKHIDSVRPTEAFLCLPGYGFTLCQCHFVSLMLCFTVWRWQMFLIWKGYLRYIFVTENKTELWWLSFHLTFSLVHIVMSTLFIDSPWCLFCLSGNVGIVPIKELWSSKQLTTLQFLFSWIA